MLEKKCWKPYPPSRQGRWKNNDNIYFSTEIIKCPNHNPIFSTDHLETISFHSKGVIFVPLYNDLGNFEKDHFLNLHSVGTYNIILCIVRANLHTNIQRLEKKQATEMLTAPPPSLFFFPPPYSCVLLLALVLWLMNSLSNQSKDP